MSLPSRPWGDTATVSATVTDARDNVIANARVDWSNSDPSVATVDSAGLVTAVASGDASVTATLGDLVAGTEVTVTQVPDFIAVEPSELAFSALGDTATLTATVIDTDGAAIVNAEVAWSSDDPAVATVSSEGMVVAVGTGNASVTAAFGDLAAPVGITVTQVPHAISVEPSELAFSSLGDTATVSATVTDARDNVIANARVDWSSSDPSVATVDVAGLVTAVASGDASVTATLGDLEARTDVTVTQVPDSIAVEPSELAFSALGDTATVTATVIDTDGAVIVNAEVEWSSDDPAVATVSSEGLVMAVGVGDASVTAAFGDLAATVGITVIQVPRAISVEPSELAFSFLGDTATVSATVTDARDNVIANAGVDWSSSDPSVAMVDSAGLVTAVAPGNTLVTAHISDLEASARITVDQVPDEISVVPADILFSAIADTATLTATVTDEAGNVIADTEVVWTTSDTSVVTVDQAGLVMAAGPGVAVVTATLEDLVASASVTVAQVADSIFVYPSELAFSSLGDTATLAATVLDANAHAIAAAPVAWSSSDTSVATVDSTGLVTTVAPGNTLVTANIGDLEASARITVDQVADSISVEPSELAFAAVGDTATVVAAVWDANGNLVTAVPVLWASTDSMVATVDTAGLVSSVGNGTATITAKAGAVSGTAEVTVAQMVSVVAVNPATGNLVVGDTLHLAAEAFDANGHRMEGAGFVWSSNDPTVATVDTAGVVRAVAAGRVTITALSAQADIRGTSTITVRSLTEPDRATLEVLYQSTGGSRWTRSDGWLSDDPLGQWYGVETDSTGRVTSIRLGGNNLVGTLPPEIGDLAALDTLDLYDNEGITGPLPPEIGKATRLRDLNLGELQLIGPIPTTLAKLVDLRRLNLEYNWFDGPIPSELGMLRKLEFLNLFSNTLTGGVPAELASIQTLVWLFVDDNYLSGVIPSAFTRLENLRGFYFGENDGLCVPDTPRFVEWSGERVMEGPRCNEADRAILKGLFHDTGGEDWTQSSYWLSQSAVEEWHGIDADSLGRVRVLDLSQNGLTGRISPGLAELDRLVVLRLGGNALTGPIPTALMQRPLEEFRYGGTDLCVPQSKTFEAWLQAIPVLEGSDERCPRLTERDILTALYEQAGGDAWTRRDNWLSDAPLDEWYGVEIDDSGKVTGLKLLGNGLRGRIASELTQLDSLRHLNLSYNWLEGTVPQLLSDLARIEFINLDSNRLTGRIPPQLGGLTELKVLRLEDNRLRGPIPPELAGMSAVTDLRLGINPLSGTIPPWLGSLTELRTLSLQANDLEGRIPPEIGRLSLLEDLRMSENRLSGPIPPELGNLSRVKVIWLDANELEGPLPPELGNLRSVETLYLGANKFSGEIPGELGSLQNVRALALDDNELTGPIPTELGFLRNLDTELNLRFNRLSGPIPPELGNLRLLQALRLDHNRLEGTVPPEIGRMTYLSWLAVAHNEGLSGPLPPSLRGPALSVAVRGRGYDVMRTRVSRRLDGARAPAFVRQRPDGSLPCVLGAGGPVPYAPCPSRRGRGCTSESVRNRTPKHDRDDSAR